MKLSDELISYAKTLLKNHTDKMEGISPGNSEVIAWLIAESICNTEKKLNHRIDLSDIDHVLAEVVNLIVHKSSKCHLKGYSNFCLTAKNKYMNEVVKGLGGNGRN